MDYDVIIIGSGAAGLSAAIYLARAEVKTLVVGDPKTSQLHSAYEVENYFGFPDSISGRELLKIGKKHAEKCGAHVMESRAVNISEESGKFYVKLESLQKHSAKYLIIASGMLASLDFAKSLNLKMQGKKLINVDLENRTSHNRVYAAGNCSTSTRQIAKDVGDGCNAAINIIKKIKNQPNYTDYGPLEG
ncbi:MAG: FAD-dependent oxidoreductase [archaeon]